MNGVSGVPPVTNQIQAAGASTASPCSKLAKVAQEFEAILLSTWLEKVQQGFAGPNDSQDAGHDTLASMGTQAIASALAARGGLGIAQVVLRQLTGHKAEKAG